jgi:hypothetical protein
MFLEIYFLSCYAKLASNTMGVLSLHQRDKKAINVTLDGISLNIKHYRKIYFHLLNINHRQRGIAAKPEMFAKLQFLIVHQSGPLELGGSSTRKDSCRWPILPKSKWPFHSYLEGNGR